MQTCFVCNGNISAHQEYIISVKPNESNRYQHTPCMRNNILKRLHQFIDGDIGGSC